MLIKERMFVSILCMIILIILLIITFSIKTYLEGEETSLKENLGITKGN